MKRLWQRFTSTRVHRAAWAAALVVDVWFFYHLLVYEHGRMDDDFWADWVGACVGVVAATVVLLFLYEWVLKAPLFKGQD